MKRYTVGSIDWGLRLDAPGSRKPGVEYEVRVDDHVFKIERVASAMRGNCWFITDGDGTRVGSPATIPEVKRLIVAYCNKHTPNVRNVALKMQAGERRVLPWDPVARKAFYYLHRAYPEMRFSVTKDAVGDQMIVRRER